MEEFSAQLTTAILTSQILEILKKQQWFPFLNEWSSGRWQRFIAVVAALLTSLGIGYSIDYTFIEGGKIVFVVPSGYLLLHGLFDMIKQFALQEFSYKAAFKPTTQPMNIIGLG